MSCNNLTLLLDEKDIKPLYEMITLNHLMYLLGYKSNRPNTIFFQKSGVYLWVNFPLTVSVCKMIN